MRKLLLALSLLLFAACAKDGGVRYTGLEMGQLCSGIFTTDQQVQLTVSDNPSGYDLQTDRRVMARYQALPGEGGLTISLTELWETVTLSPAPVTEAPGLVTDDPVRLEDAWFSGGYLNIGLRYEGSDPDLHRFALTYAAEAGKMTLRLYHDNRETAREDGSRHIYLCFPLEPVTEAFRKEVSADAKRIPILLSWNGYGDQDQSSPEILRQEGNYRP